VTSELNPEKSHKREEEAQVEEKRTAGRGRGKENTRSENLPSLEFLAASRIARKENYSAGLC
jgi:hypothetical protein